MEECPSRNLICSRSPPAFRQSFAQVRRRSWAPKRSIPIWRADSVTMDQIAQSPRLAPTFPPLVMDRSSGLFVDPRRGLPGFDALFDPHGYGDGADASALAAHVDYDP